MSQRKQGRIRWWIANQIDRLPGQCWTELAMYGLGYRRWPWSPISSTCRADAERCGACYCGKLKRREGGAS